jgi:hypothetical protein
MFLKNGFLFKAERYLPSFIKKMKRSLIVSAVFIFFIGCKNSSSVDKSDPLESGRGFIEASLKGDYITAKKYLLDDSTNLQYFEGLKDFNSKMDVENRRGYSDANIIIDSSIAKSDSVNIIYYTNSFKNKPSKIKVVKRHNEWLVDFKYTFIEN